LIFVSTRGHNIVVEEMRPAHRTSTLRILIGQGLYATTLWQRRTTGSFFRKLLRSHTGDAHAAWQRA
jgi:hypothetical protein